MEGSTLCDDEQQPVPSGMAGEESVGEVSMADVTLKATMPGWRLATLRESGRVSPCLHAPFSTYGCFPSRELFYYGVHGRLTPYGAVGRMSLGGGVEWRGER
jgi:hypothetical protein